MNTNFRIKLKFKKQCEDVEKFDLINYIFDMDAEEEDSNEKETFQEDTIVIEQQETPEIGCLAGKLKK